MAELLTGLLVSTVSGTVLAALLFLAKPFVKGRISQKSQYYSWYLVFIRMLLPFSFGGIFIGNLIPFLQSRAAQTPANLASMGTVSAATSAIVPSVGAASALQSGALANAAQGNIFSVDYWYLFLFTVWLLGMIAILGFTIVSYIGYAFQIKSTRIQVKGETILALLKECCEEYNISEPLPLYVSSCTDTPMLCGLFRGAIILPDKSFTSDQFKHAFMHELAHYRKHDNLLKWITVLSVSANWFNPIAYLAAREAGRRCELSCDEIVTANYTKEERVRYGRTLLAVASKYDHKPFALSATMNEDKRNLKERLEALTKIRRSGRKTTALSASLLFIVVAAAALTLMVSCAKNTASPGPKESEKASASDSAVASNAGHPSSGVENNSDVSVSSDDIPSASYLDNFLSYAQNHGFKTLMNSSISGFIRLPSSFSGTINSFDIGRFLESRNALSKKNGFDFSGYLGKALTAYSCDGEKRQPGDNELTEVGGGPNTVCIIGLYDGGKMVGFWSHSFSDKDDDFSILSDYLIYVPSTIIADSNPNYVPQIINTVNNTWRTKYSDISITNGWLSGVVSEDIRYIVLAGALKSDPHQGVVEVVTTHRDGTTVKSSQRFLCPRKNGALTVASVGAKDTTMGLHDTDGHSWNFHIYNGFDPQTPVG